MLTIRGSVAAADSGILIQIAIDDKNRRTPHLMRESFETVAELVKILSDIKFNQIEADFYCHVEN